MTPRSQARLRNHAKAEVIMPAPAAQTMLHTDVLIVGGGIAGLICAARLGSDGWRVLVVDRADALLADGADPDADLRTTALLMPAIATLERAGLWALLADDATPLARMRLLDAGGRANIERSRADFDAREVGQAIFGYNLANPTLRAALRRRLAQLPSVMLRSPAEVAQLSCREDGALATLSSGEAVRAKLVVGADGRDSAMRQRAGIAVRRIDYGQKALVFAVAHEWPHQNTSTEIHRSGGPFTLVPMAGNHSSVVWMERNEVAAALMAQDDAGFLAAAQERSLHILGRLRLLTRRAAWPIIAQIADRLTARRLVLIAEAAHVVPPIGAQGLNMSLADIEGLAGLMADPSRDPGAEALLVRYQRDRWFDMAARVGGIDMLNRAALAENQWLRDLRHAGLGLIHGIGPLRRQVMRMGMGVARAGGWDPKP